MIKEEFVDKIAVANQTIKTLNVTIDKVEQTKREAISIYLQANIKLDPGQRVRVYRNDNDKNIDDKKLLGYGYVKGALVDEDYGIIFYPLVKENLKDKSPSKESFESPVGVLFDDFEFCNTLIEIA